MFTQSLSERLPVVLLSVERGDVVGEFDTDMQIEALAELAAVAFDQARADGQFGGYGAVSTVRTLNDTQTVDPANDMLMVSHIRELLKSSAVRGFRSARGKAKSSGVPFEDRGKTVQDHTGLTDAGSLQVTGGPLMSTPAPGPQASIAQWVPIGIWALQTIGKIIANRRARKNAPK